MVAGGANLGCGKESSSGAEAATLMSASGTPRGRGRPGGASESSRLPQLPAGRLSLCGRSQTRPTRDRAIGSRRRVNGPSLLGSGYLVPGRPVPCHVPFSRFPHEEERVAQAWLMHDDAPSRRIGFLNLRIITILEAPGPHLLQFRSYVPVGRKMGNKAEKQRMAENERSGTESTTSLKRLQQM
jgi:hypothetical protein